MIKNIVFFTMFSFIAINSTGGINSNYIDNSKGSKTSYTEKSEEIDIMIKPNFPPSIRTRISFAIPRTKVIEQYGEPQETKKIDEYTYDMWNMKDGSKVFAIYHESIFKDSWQFKNIPTNKMFEDLTVNKSDYNEVLKIDPYSFLWKPFKKNTMIFSEHRVTNEEVVRVEYINIDDRFIVKEIEYHLSDPYNFYSIIDSDV
ncbi:hypothetical protein ABDB91_03335 [Desulfoscipio sp. XC116]|uniref:hypothetical protein n=1 Tax=Desulfoscipio sp. XC116 TaxID=3144975 RepID=UPI00325B61D4